MKTTIIILALAVLTYAHVFQSNYGLGNTRHATDSTISTANIGSLAESWRFTTAGDVMGQATTATVNGVDVVFFADAAGWIYSVALATGGLIWKVHAGSITGISTSYSRNAPAFFNNRIYLGDQVSSNFFCLDARNGQRVWITQLDPNPRAIVTQSATVDNGMVFVGCSSNDGGQQVVTFRGFLSRLDANTGAVVWKSYMAPQGYTGVGVWGSSPAIDYGRNTVYCTTGNNYELPQSVITCINNGGGKACMDPTNYVDSIVAINIDTGVVRWATNFNGVDYWNTKLCPKHDSCGPNYKDFDFGQGPMLFTVNGVDAVGAGQKGGLVHAVNRDNGQPIWTTRTGEGTAGGGMLHGSTVDDKHVYVGDTNNWGEPKTLKDGSVCAGFQGYWSALDKNTGAIVWQRCNPTGYKAFGPLTSVPGGLMFAGSIDPAGKAYAFRATDGAIVWQTELGGAVGSGAALTGDYLIWGAGYSKWGIGSAGRRITAFKVGGSNTPTTTLPGTPSTASPTSYDTRNCWTCPAGQIHWFQAGLATAPGGDRCACVPYSGTPTTSTAPGPSTTTSPTSYDTRGCWTCPAGQIHWFQAGLATAPGGDRCACIPYSGNPPAPAPTTTAPGTPSTSSPTSYDTRNCWTCPAGQIHWFQAGLATAPGGDRCACVPNSGSPTTTTTRAPGSSTTAAPSSCWTCPAGQIHWFDAGMASAPGGDRCACVQSGAAPSPNTPSTTSSCWTCPSGWKHWYELGMSAPGNGDRCQCIKV